MMEKFVNSKIIIPDKPLEDYVRRKTKLPEASKEDQREKESSSMIPGLGFSEGKKELSLSEKIIKAAYAK